VSLRVGLTMRNSTPPGHPEPPVTIRDGIDSVETRP
jgi:hypothetical protein